MPSRIIREGILDSEAINALSDDGEIFYRRLMSIVDDFGRFEDKPELIRARCFPLKLADWSLTRVSEALAEVSKPLTNDGKMRSLVCRYEVDGKKYLQINNFGQRERSSKFPAPPNDGNPPSNDGHVTDRRRPNSESESEAYSESESEAKSGAFPPVAPPLQDTWGIWPDAEIARNEILEAYPKGKVKFAMACSWWMDFIVANPNAQSLAVRIFAVAKFIRDNCPDDRRGFLPNAVDFLSGDWQRDWAAEWRKAEPEGNFTATMRAIQEAGRTA